MPSDSKEKRSKRRHKEKKLAEPAAEDGAAEEDTSRAEEDTPAAVAAAEEEEPTTAAADKGESGAEDGNGDEEAIASAAAKESAGEADATAETADTADAEALEAEIALLEEQRVSEADIGKMFQKLPSAATAGFAELSKFAREISAAIDDPEVVVVGSDANGKGAAVEALLGFRTRAAGAQSWTRGVQFQLQLDPECEEPRFTIKGDSVKKGYKSDVACSAADLPTELAARQTATFHSQMIQIRCESADFPNLTILESASLDLDSDDDERSQAILDVMKPNHRLIVGIEEAADSWDDLKLVNFCSKADIQGSRTAFGLTKLSTLLVGMGTARDLNQLLSRKPANVRACVFFTPVSPAVTLDCADDGELFRERVAQSWAHDKKVLESELRFDLRRNEKSFGFHQLRDVVLQDTWKNYKDVIPELRKHLAASKKEKTDALKAISDSQTGGSDDTPLRAMTSNFVAAWLSAVANVIEGSPEGNTQLNGQTMSDESVEIGEWCDRFNTSIPLVPSRYKELANWDNKIFGSPQIERLIHAFKIVALKSHDATVTGDDIETAISTGYYSLMREETGTFSATQAASIVSLIVARAVGKIFDPLVAHLCDAAKYSLQRMANLAFGILDNRRSDRTRAEGLQSMRGYAYFASSLRDIFEDYADRTTSQCHTRCKDEIVSGEFVTEPDSGKEWNEVFPHTRNDFQREDLVNAAQAALSHTVDVVAKNIVLTAHHFLVVAFPRDVSGEILQEVAKIDSKELETMFEMSQVREQLAADEKKLKDDLEALLARETSLRTLTGAFSRYRTE